MGIFQTFEHNGRVLQLATHEPVSSSKPAKSSAIRAPGAGKFEIGQINISAPLEKLTAGGELTLTARVIGKNIAFIYTDILLKDKSADQFYGPVAREYIQADRNKETGGVSRPGWDETINLAVRLRPNLRLLTDGVDSAFGFLTPESYSNSDYLLEGLYNSEDGATQRRARIIFDSNGNVKEILAFKEQGRQSMPHTLTLKHGDQFTPFVQIHTPPAEEKGKWEMTTALSTPLTFREQPFQLVTEAPMPGEYLVGILIQDLDGGFTRKYSPLTIL